MTAMWPFLLSGPNVNFFNLVGEMDARARQGGPGLLDAGNAGEGTVSVRLLADRHACASRSRM